MKTAHKMFVRNALSVALLVALATPVLAEVDGWDFSGQNARSQALASDYKNLVDSYNIWVNPALVVKHSNRVDINITDQNSLDIPDIRNTRDTEGAGIYKTFGANTFGAFIGRPSESALALISGLDPRNQFDLFYGWHGVVDLGARLNIQAISEENVDAPFTVKSPNVFQATDTFRNTFNSLENSGEASSNELNLGFGVADPAGHWDATLLWGTPSAERKSNFSGQNIDEVFFPAGTITGRDTLNQTFSSNNRDDGAQNLGLTGRLIDIGIPNSIITLGWQSLDYGSKGRSSRASQTINDNNTIGTVTAADGDVNMTDNDASTTQSALEGNRIDLFFTKNFVPMSNTLVLATLGWSSTSSKSRSVTTIVTDNSVDNFTGIVTNFTPVGTQTNTTFESSANALPLILGFEGDVNSNWTLRAGVRKDLFISEVDETTTELWEVPITSTGSSPLPNINTVTTKNEFTRVWDTDTTISLGGGYKNGSLAINAVVLKQFVTRGFDEGLVGRLSVTWSI